MRTTGDLAVYGTLQPSVMVGIQTDYCADMEDTVDKFDIRKHVQPSIECIGAEWQIGRAHV